MEVSLERRWDELLPADGGENKGRKLAMMNFGMSGCFQWIVKGVT